MKVIILAAILGFTSSARLDNLYLPPNQRASSGAFGSHSNGAYEHSSSVFSAQPSNFRAQTYSSNNLNEVPILKFAADNDGEGSYRYNYETANSISAEEQGDAQGDGTRAHGSYSFTSPEGEHISVSYTADENGFVPQGSHIPTPPPVPEAILKALQENAAAEARGIFDDGSYHGEGLNEGQYHGEGQRSGSFIRNSGSVGGYAASGGYSSNGGYKY